MLSPTTNEYMTESGWRGHPERPCANDDRYSDLTLVKPKGALTRKKQIEEMRNACLTRCPVFRFCRNDVLTATKDWEFYGLQAGIVGKT